MAGKDDVEAEVEASAGGSRFGVANASEGVGRLLDGGCWMVWMECPPSMEGRLCGPSKSYSSLTISAELGAELVSVSPDKSVDQGKGQRGGTGYFQCFSSTYPCDRDCE